MDSPKKPKIGTDAGEDRISMLADELIHQVFYNLDTRLAVQTCILSKRWKFIWTTLPFLRFNKQYKNSNNFVDHVFSRRNHNSNILKLKIYHCGALQVSLTYVNYAILHNVQDLDYTLFSDGELFYFTSVSLKKLCLVKVNNRGPITPQCWDLPALTILSLSHINLPNSFNLPALTTLSLGFIILLNSFSLPSLTTLHLVRCMLPDRVWDLPALINLKLNEVLIPRNMNEFFSVLVSLQNLTLLFKSITMRNCVISCPQLVYLEVRATTSGIRNSDIVDIKILAPKLRDVNIAGIFSISCALSKLDNVNIELDSCFLHKGKNAMSWGRLQYYYHRLPSMFQGLSSAKILTLDMDTIEPSRTLIFSVLQLKVLKYVKLPHTFKVSSLCGTVKSYLNGGSMNATIVTTLPKDNVIAQVASFPVIAQNGVPEDPLATPTMKLVDSQGIHSKLSTDTLETRVQEEHEVESSGLVDKNVRQVGPLVQGLGELVPNAPGAANDLARSFRWNKKFGLWQGHEVNLEFIGLLDLIMKKYPETFEHFTSKSKKLCTLKLNMLCTSVDAFTTTSVTEIDTELITEYRKLFAYLQTSFNLSWLVSRLNDIEQLQFSQQEHPAIDSCTNSAESKLQVFPTLAAQKMTKMQEARGTTGTNLASSYVGDGLFSAT